MERETTGREDLDSVAAPVFDEGARIERSPTRLARLRVRAEMPAAAGGGAG